MAVRILIVDDHLVVRTGLAALLGTQPDFEVVGEADSGDYVLPQIEALRPDILLLDLELPGTLDGVGVIEALMAAGSRIRILVFTAFDTDERIIASIKAGAHGYLLKGAPRQTLFDAIRTVAAGGSLIEPVVASKLMAHLREQSQTDSNPVDPLTAREQEVLQQMSEGFQNKEIAQHLAITERTVKFHVSGILSKLGATNRTEAVHKAQQLGLL